MTLKISLRQGPTEIVAGPKVKAEELVTVMAPVAYCAPVAQVYVGVGVVTLLWSKEPFAVRAGVPKVAWAAERMPSACTIAACTEGAGNGGENGRVVGGSRVIN